METWIHIPIMLILSLDYEGLTETWCLPKKLKLFQNTSHLEGLHYNLSGKAIYSPSIQHFTSRFHNGNAIYEHDGLHHSGSSVKIQKGTISQYLQEKIQTVSGTSSYTNAVIYVLQGGIKAQEEFQKIQKKVLANHHILVNYNSPTTLSQATLNPTIFSLFPSEERFWLTNPSRQDIQDYICISPQDIPHVTPKETQITPNAPSILKRQHSNQHHISIQSDEDDEASYPQQKHPPRYLQRVESDSEGQVVIHKTKLKRLPKPMSMSTLSPIPEITGISSNASVFPISCRCGHTGDGNEEAAQGFTNDYIHCDECHNWSHIACQREGRASNLGNKPFICDECDMVQIKLALRPRSERYVKLF
jgi:hypothetical protein